MAKKSSTAAAAPAATAPAATTPVVETTTVTETQTESGDSQDTPTESETADTVVETPTESEGNDADSTTATEPTDTPEDQAVVVTDEHTAPDLSDEALKALVPESLKPTESLITVATRGVLDLYAAEMNPLKPSEKAVRVTLQNKLLKQLERVIAIQDGVEFVTTMDVVMSYFADSALTAFRDTAPFRDFDSIPVSKENRQWFSDVLNVLIAMGPVATRSAARATFDLKVSTRNFKEDAARERFIAYINRIAGRS